MNSHDSIVLGIDFGTSTTSASVVIGSDIRSVRLGDGPEDGAAMPTAVFIQGQGRFLVGEQAVNTSQSDPVAFHENFKRKIGLREPINASGCQFSYGDLVAAVLRHVKLSAEHEWNNDQPIRNAVLTVPLLYVEGGDSWNAMLEAAHSAGIQEVRLVREPHAAAALYQNLLPKNGGETYHEGEITLVYDLGGGTFDPALLMWTNGAFRILGSGEAGIRCGGTYFDEVLLDDFSAKCPQTMAQLQFAPPRESDSVEVVLERSRQRFAFLRISEFLRKAKHRLSRPECHEFREKNPVTGEEYAITKGEFEALILPLVEATMAACASMVERCGVEWARITRFLMVGGSCRIPLIRKRLDALARERGAGGLEISCGRIGTTDKSYDPALAVSFGAAWEASRELQDRQIKEGDRHYFGQGVPQDYAQAEACYRVAAQRGNAEAQYDMGVLYSYGRGVPKDLSEAAKWYRRASEQGHPEAQANLGQLLVMGVNGSKNFEEAFRWLSLAARADHPKAQYLLGILYRNGQGIDQDHVQAAKLLQSAADQGYVGAYGELAYLYQSGLGVPKNLTEAVSLYRRGAESGDMHSQYSLGLLCKSGQGTVANPMESEKWFRLAAEQGHAQAQHQLGLLMSRRNAPEAVQWLQKASQQGVIASTTRLAELLLDGRLVAKDNSAARRLLEAAKAKGDAHAIELLRKLDASATPMRSVPPPRGIPGQGGGARPAGLGGIVPGARHAQPPPLPPRGTPPPPQQPPPLPPGYGTGRHPRGPKP